MIPFTHPLIGSEEKMAVLEVLASGQLAQGKKVYRFESDFAAWCGRKYAIAVSSGTAALHVALLAHGIGRGSEVITSPFSSISSANCILYVGARPVFVDIEPDYFTLDPAAVVEKITSKTRAIVAVHLFGQPCEMDVLAEIAQEHDLVLIEDATQAHGAKFQHEMVGSWGTACYSFYPTQNMTTGEGGMVTTDDVVIAEKVRMLREHGIGKRQRQELLGYDYRMTDMQAALGIVQLDKLSVWNRQRQANAAYLTNRLEVSPYVATPEIRAGATHVFHQYTVRVPNRSRVIHALSQHSIGTGVYYRIPVHQQYFYQELGCDSWLPYAEACSQEVLSLPVHPALTHDDLDQIVDVVLSSVAVSVERVRSQSNNA